MNALDLKQGDRRIVIGKERAYHGSFNCGTVLDFVRQINDTTIEYCSFSKLSVDEKGELTGSIFSTYEAKRSSSPETIGNDSIDLYSRGMKLWNRKRRSRAA